MDTLQVVIMIAACVISFQAGAYLQLRDRALNLLQQRIALLEQRVEQIADDIRDVKLLRDKIT